MINRMKKMVLTGAMVMATMSFAVPAVAQANPVEDSPAQTRSDPSVAHQPGGFHPYFPSQWLYGQISPVEGVEA